ncbi:MAG: aldo/keto reductase [Bacteroidota bacterium]|nr:aldo/keto reductase [Bacteroidota bacterium]
MQYRRLGKSGLQLSLFSFGSWITFGNQIDDKISEGLMAYAYDHGVNFFDNAEVYANGQSEIVMGRILKKMNWDRSSYLVSSKVYFGRGSKLPNLTGLNRKHIMEACHESLNRLQVDYLDLYFCHRPDKQTPMDETVWAMNHLLQQGKILYWGTSEWSAQEIMEAHMVAKENRLIGPVMEQPQYNMFIRKKVEVEYAQIYKTVGLGTTIWSPLASGTLSDKNLTNLPSDSRLNRKELQWIKDKNLTEENLHMVKELQKLSAQLDMPLSNLALAWCAQNQHVSSIILGASKLVQLEENLNVVNNMDKITPEINERIEQILKNKPEASPY